MICIVFLTALMPIVFLAQAQPSGFGQSPFYKNLLSNRELAFNPEQPINNIVEYYSLLANGSDSETPSLQSNKYHLNEWKTNRQSTIQY